MADLGSDKGAPGVCRRDGRPFRIRGVVFDFDGTLTKPGEIDFVAIHEAVGCPRETGLLEYLVAIADPEERRRKEQVLEAAETEAAARCRVNEGVKELVTALREWDIPMAVITRNRREAVDVALGRLEGIAAEDFTVMITRDTPISPKPFPDGIRFVAQELDLEIGTLLVIGDHAFDVEAGLRAGALTMYLRNGPRESSPPEGSDFVVETLADAGRIIRYGLPLPVGKLPAEFLAEGVQGMAEADPDVLIGAGVGEDSAAVAVEGAEMLVMASDPTTLAEELMARYAVLTNANDVATSGVTPRWLLATLLFPPGSSASEILALIHDIRETCVAQGISLCGGHTEVTDSVTRPLVAGAMVGTGARADLIDKRGMREGDRILFTKAVAVEGTGLVAVEHGRKLARAGIPAAEIAEAARFLDRISIVKEAELARSFAGVSALHDVTEGGLATALSELSAAGGRRLRVHMEKIPVYPQTRLLCEALSLDPLGLIGSGSLLIACAPDDTRELAATIDGAGIEITEIGEVLGAGAGIEALRQGVPVEWPLFPHDEVSRLSR